MLHERMIISKKPMGARLSTQLSVFAVTCLLGTRASATPLPDEISATRQVCARGPDHALLRAHRQRGEAEAKAAAVLPNPSLVVEHDRSVTGPIERETVIGVAVPIGLGGRRSLFQEVASARKTEANADAQVALFESALAFREAYVSAVIDRARLEVLIDHQKLLDGLSSVIKGLVKGGEAAGYDVLRQRTQARTHRRMLEAARGRAAESQAALAEWTGADVTLPATPVWALAAGAAGPGPSTTPNTSPRVRSLESASRAFNLEARAARRRWVPELELFAGYRALELGAEVGHGLSFGVTLPITFFDHGQGDAARADAQGELARASADRLRRHLDAQITAARRRIEQLTVGVADSTMAEADAAALQRESMRLYTAGEATITELLEAFDAAEQARLRQLELAEELARSRLALMRAAGSMFDAKLDHDCGANGRGQP